MSLLAYSTLERDEIRLLTLQYVPDVDHGEAPPISCELETVTLSDLQSQLQDESTPIDDDRWPGFNQTRLDFSALFKPKKRHRLIGAPERSWKRYVESLDVQTAQNVIADQADGTIVTPSPSLSRKYIALSYAWGPDEGHRTIILNGAATAVRPNLYAALLELRKTPWVRRGIRLWIDAICINQDNIEEREQQVSIMRSIYVAAWQVVAWLGPSTGSTSLAYTALAWLARAIGSGDRLKEFAAEHGIPHYAFDAAPVMLEQHSLPWRDAVVPALQSFFAREYWHRLWILQELAMAKADAPVLWGAYAMPLREIWVACEAMDENEATAIDRRLEERHTTPGQQWKHLIRIKHLRKEEEEAEEADGGHSVEFAIPTFELARQAEATDKRDKVYGILGIPGVRQLVTMSPNLHLEVGEVYANFTRHVIMNDGLDIIRLVHSPVGPVMSSWFNADNPRWLQALVAPRYTEVAGACTHNLPSWVVCWACKGAPLARLPRRYRAHDGLASPDVRFSRDGALSSRAVLVDGIANVSAFNIAEADESYPRNGPAAAPLPNAYGDLAGLKEAFWRTVVGDSTSAGDAPPASWRLLVEQRRWGRFGTSDFIGPGINFGLHSFALRNLELRLPGGHLLGAFLGYRGPHHPWGGNLKSDVLEEHSELDERNAVSWASNALAWRRLVVTRHGRLGLTVAAVTNGDVVAVLPGCSAPVVIRRVSSGWRLVGEIFVHGLMAGETAAMVRDGLVEVNEIRLH